MDAVFFSELALPQPRYHLHIHGGGHATMTGKMMIALEGILQQEKPDVIYVQGDTNTVLA